MANWTVAPSIKAALAEADRLWPNRNRASDGTVGDAHHQAEVSDHNPDANGIVHAFDLTHDPNGPTGDHIATLLHARVLSGEETRVKYVIWDRQIFTPALARIWRPYNGPDPHTSHVHVSILSGQQPEQNVSPWWSTAVPKEDDVPKDKDNVAACACWSPGCGGLFLLQYDGGVLSVGDHTADHFRGSYFSLPDTVRNDPNRRFIDIVTDVGLGYFLVANTGEYYGMLGS